MRTIGSWMMMAVLVLPGCGGGNGGDGGSADEHRPLNDTGVTLCADFPAADETSQNNLDCAAAGAGMEMPGIDADGDHVPAGQDALYGRDAEAMMAANAVSGVTGFSFTRLSAAGVQLPADASGWACVRDNVTGLVWEVKSNNDGLRDRHWTYTWANSQGAENGGSAGVPDAVAAEGEGTDNCFNPARCDTEKYVEDINAIQLCGLTGWRLPSADELRSIVHFGRFNPALPVNYFPDSATNKIYWSATSDADLANKAWAFDFYGGEELLLEKEDEAAVRLVHVGKPRDVTYDVLGNW